MTTNWPYFDSMSSTPLDPRVFEVMKPFYESNFANPSSSLYPAAWEAQQAIQKSTSQLNSFFHFDEWIYTSGATESILSVIVGFSETATAPLILTSPFEHSATLSAIRLAQRLNPNLRHQIIQYGNDAQPETQALLKDLQNANGEVLLSLIQAQNEIGVVLDMERLRKTLIPFDHVYLHIDGSQSVGKHPSDRSLEGVDFFSFSSHKIYGPKGIGALGITSRGHSRFQPLIVGGHQQKGLRGGTLPTALIVGMGKAVEIMRDEKTEWVAKSSSQKFEVIQFLQDRFSNIKFWSSLKNDLSLPHLVSFCLPQFLPSEIQKAMWGIAYSTGSACSSESKLISKSLEWKGATQSEAASTVRLSLHRFTSDFDVEALRSAFNRLPQIS